MIRRAAALALLGITGVAAMGRFRSSLALTLGASVAIVSALWLSDFVGRLAPERSANARLDVRFILKSILRYAFSGLVLLGAVRGLPDEVPWLLAGLSCLVASVVVEGLVGLRTGGQPGTARGR
jgi:hypothetical protein